MNKYPMHKFDPPEVFYWGPELDRETALALGRKRYFTGIPCKWGHVSERLAGSRHCIKCIELRCKTEEWKEHERERWAADEVWRASHATIRREYRATENAVRRQRYAEDPEYRERMLAGNREAYQRRKAEPKLDTSSDG